jgi:maltose O-acetyltransferase
MLFIRRIRYSRFASDVRCRAYSIAGADIGDNVIIRPNVSLTNCNSITIGDNTFIGENTIMSATDSSITIEANVLIAPNCIFVARTHEIHGLEPINNLGALSKPIVIENGSWIGANVSILYGVTLGGFSVVAANCVLNKSFPPYSVVGGVPSKLLKSRRG